MKQKCPRCGEWCHAESRSFTEKALDSGSEAFNTGAKIGAKIGGIFGKKGENLGRKLGYVSAGREAIVNGLIGGLSECDCHFVCDNCGYEWDANEDEDQTDILQSEKEELVAQLSDAIFNEINSEEDYYNHDVEGLCRELAGHDYCESLFWLSKAQTYVAISKHQGYDDTLEIGEDEENDSQLEESNKWFSMAYKSINQSLKLYFEDDSYQENDGPHAIACAFNQKAWIEYYMAESIDEQTIARNSFIDAMDTEFDDVKEDAITGYNHSTDRLLDTFGSYLNAQETFADLLNDEEETIRKYAARKIREAENSKFIDIPYVKRQFIFVTKDSLESIAGCTDNEDNIRYVFTIGAIPKGLSFPVGHPQQNTLYVANPVIKGNYIPFKDAEDKLFHDKVNDFIRLSQCLGATEISFHSIKGQSISQGFQSSANYGGNVSVKGNSVSGEYGVKQHGDSSYNSSKEVELTRRYDPIRKPYCPDDVEWLELDPEWKKFVRQRLEGNVLEASMRISSTESICSNTNTLRNVKAAFENMMVKVDANYDSEEDNTFSSTESTEWQITVHFRSIRDFFEDESTLTTNGTSDVVLTPAEEKYKEEVIFMLEDGDIDDAARRMLERKRVKLGISEERAVLIESQLKPSLTDEEKEYIETFKEICIDGEISPRIRKMLDREADSLGISKDRASQLENMI